MAYIKNVWQDGETIATAERMNHIEDGIKENENISNNINEKLDKKLDKTSVKTTKTASDNDTYSCNYIDGIKRINNVYLLSFASKSSLKVHSTNGYGVFVIICSTNVSIVQFTGLNAVPNIYDVYGTHPFSVSCSENIATLSSLNAWDHHIFMGSNEISNVEF